MPNPGAVNACNEWWGRRCPKRAPASAAGSVLAGLPCPGEHRPGGGDAIVEGMVGVFDRHAAAFRRAGNGFDIGYEAETGIAVLPVYVFSGRAVPEAGTMM